MVEIASSLASLLVMPLLGEAKRRTFSDLNSAALHADSRQTSICTYLSAILLGGLLLNAVAGWWWADPLALAMFRFIIVMVRLVSLVHTPIVLRG